MPLTRNFNVQQGDTKKIVIPMFDGDDPDSDYYADIDKMDVEFAIASSYDATTAEWVASDSDLEVIEFQNVKLGSDAFNFDDVSVEIDHTIPDTQNVIVVTVPKSTTDALPAGDTLVYHCRFEDTGVGRLTPVKGEITIDAAAPFST